MNEALRKRIPKTEAERKMQHREHEKEYMKRHRTVCVTLNKERDGDILDWLSKKENMSDAIRKALRDARQTEINHAGWLHLTRHTTQTIQEEEEC